MATTGFEAGFTALLTKPIRKAALIEALVQHAKGRTPAEAATNGVAPVPSNVVEVEEGMEDVVPAYLEKRKAEVPLYAAALAGRDFDAMKKMAHKMKGTGAGYGFPMLTELGASIERASIDQDLARVQDCVNQFQLYLGSVELKYSK
jgi:HPt (histidine-containing phosphotransfer) domain-containing protein